MTTAYSLTDTLPKDAGGAKFWGLPNVDSATLDFSLLKGIGTSSIQGKNLAHLAIGTHTQASKIEAEHPMVAIGGVYIEAHSGTSAVLSGQANVAGISQQREVYAIGAPKTAFVVFDSNVVKSTSGIVHSFSVAWKGAAAGDSVSLKDDTSTKCTIVFNAGSGFETFHIPNGGIDFATSISALRDATISSGGLSIMGSYY